MIGIINYGAGNIYSVLMAVKKLGKPAMVIEKPGQLDDCDNIILPGVGAFDDGRKNLADSGMLDNVVKNINSGKPFLGICLGFQLLFLRSEEGISAGFGVIGGEIKKFRFENSERRIPHMAWSKVRATGDCHELFRGIPQLSYFYFAHSYYPVPEKENKTIGLTEYGINFCSVLKHKNIVGVQFHPEKSGEKGLLFVKNFLEEKWLR
jgi:imidazole glycerol-phosphate synthase subunit HisH